MVRDNPLVTIKPEKFNLQRMIRGQEFVVKTDVYIGHFEREGMLMYEGVPITLAEQLFVRQLTDLQEASRI
ncbi:MAG: hypothetical protein MK214_06965 [Thalassotalea sp.]|nr:hypothetical protein [Thalassotalea sp.]